MNLFSKKTNTEVDESEEYSTLTLPFVKDEHLRAALSEKPAEEVKPEPKAEEPKREEAKKAEPQKKEADAKAAAPHKEPQNVTVYPGGISPLEALKRKMSAETAEVAKEFDAEKKAEHKAASVMKSAPAAPVTKQAPTDEAKKADSVAVPLKADMQKPVRVATAPKAQHTSEEELKKIAENIAAKPVDPKPEPQEKPSLLKRCMPYIYDEDGVSQVDTKPDYVLESVEDIIRSAENRANEKIAERYRMTDKNGNTIKIEKIESSAKKAEPVIAAEEKPEPAEDITKTIELPTSSDILLDDFSGKRTVVTPTESVTTAYSKLTDYQTGISGEAEAATTVIPAVKVAKTDTMEDIVSHTRPVNIKDAPALKTQKPIAVTVKNDDIIPDVDDDYRTPEDAKRIGMMLKKRRRSAFSKLLVSILSVIVSAVFALIIPDNAFTEIPFLPCLIQFLLLAVSAFSNIGIFASFKNCFTKNTSAAAPVALSVTVTAVYLIIGLISGTYPSDPVLLTLIAVAVYDLFAYKHSTFRLNNFRIVASHSEKRAVALIDDQVAASSMARSSIEGEVLAAGVKKTSVLTDFIKLSSFERAFGGALGTAMIVFSALSVIFAVIVGVSHHSFDTALCVMSIILSIFAMPTYAFAEFMPLCDLGARLHKLGAMLCGKYSASRIEQSNAVVITSSELFPSGSIELFNMKTLSSNNIDSTLSCAASVAEAIGSPLVSVFNSFVDPAEKRPVADTVKYEDNLGISGWVGDNHYFIGNRTLMEAHSIKVPPLEVDRKILHKGYFPVYVAVGQRACALLIVKYNPVHSVRNELVKLVNAGITLLVENCDSNITAGMLSDYYGIYEDSIRVMDHKGVHNYKSAVKYSETYSAHAAYIGRPIGFLAIINGALRLRTVSNIMYALHIALSAIACIVFVLASLDGRMLLMHIAVCVLIEVISFVITLVTYLLTRK